MWELRPLFCCFLLFSAVALVSAQRSSNVTKSKWQTLNGNAPLVVARGGFSGLVPDSSVNAYKLALFTSLPNVVLWCDVQLSKDGAGLCLPDLLLNDCTDAKDANLVFSKQSTYLVNGVSTTGWFSIDYTFKQLQGLNLKHGDLSPRNDKFDGSQILRVQDVAALFQLPGFWLNVEHGAFYSQHNLSMRSFIISTSRHVIIDYISSPEVNFLTSIAARFKTSPTKLVFRFHGQDDIEPSTNQTYGSLLRNLTFIKTFASGILVPKDYIWPLDKNQYLLPSTSIVLDAHKQGLEVFSSGFANDATFAYNYTYDPIAEYLSFIDNGKFSVDGVLSDFPITPSEAIDCYSHTRKKDKVQVKLLIISSEGASGIYPGCTDMAYNQAISDGVDIIDCPVQMTQDGVAFCLASINLLDRTTAAQSPFYNMTTTIPELNVKNGIFAFNLTWSQIQTLQPAMHSLYDNYTLYRNPAFKNSGKIIQISDFLALAKASAVTGVLISIENAAYLAEKQGLDVVNAVVDALNKSGFSSQTSKRVMIESSDSAVLKFFLKETNYELVYRPNEHISGITNSTLLDIKKFASSVAISKQSVYPSDQLFTIGATDVVPTLQSLNLSVYVQLFSNEFVSQAWDFYSDAYTEINNYFLGMSIDGVITDYPATSAKYRRNRCLGYKKAPAYMSIVPPGGLFPLLIPGLLPPAEAPNPILTEADVAEPPLPPVVVRPPPGEAANGTTGSGPTARNGQSIMDPGALLSTLPILLAFMVTNL